MKHGFSTPGYNPMKVIFDMLMGTNRGPFIMTGGGYTKREWKASQSERTDRNKACGFIHPNKAQRKARLKQKQWSKTHGRA